MSGSLLFVGLVFGAIGTGYFVYGRRQNAIVPLVSGLLLMVVPYFVSDVLGLLAIGALIAAAPFVLRV